MYATGSVPLPPSGVTGVTCDPPIVCKRLRGGARGMILIESYLNRGRRIYRIYYGTWASCWGQLQGVHPAAPRRFVVRSAKADIHPSEATSDRSRPPGTPHRNLPYLEVGAAPRRRWRQALAPLSQVARRARDARATPFTNITRNMRIAMWALYFSRRSPRGLNGALVNTYRDP